MSCLMKLFHVCATVEEHFDANVQHRRTAMQDVRIARQLQSQEASVHKEEERQRRADCKHSE